MNISPEIDETFWQFLANLVIAGVLLTMTLLIIFHFAYKWKSPVVWPAGRLSVCWFPKYLLAAELPVSSPEAIAGQLTDRLAESGFRPVRRKDDSLMFSRGSELGDFSIKIVKVNIFVIPPVSNPVTLQIEYGALFGTVLDTGDLWTLCRELKERLERQPD